MRYAVEVGFTAMIEVEAFDTYEARQKAIESVEHSYVANDYRGGRDNRFGKPIACNTVLMPDNTTTENDSSEKGV